MTLRSSISAPFRQELSQTINTKALLKILPSQRLVKKSAKPVMLWYTLGYALKKEEQAERSFCPIISAPCIPALFIGFFS